MPKTMGAKPFDKEYDCSLLFKAIAEGDQGAFESLFLLYRSRIYALGLKWTKTTFGAEEITQDVFIAVWTARAHLAVVRNPSAYIYTIAYNKISRYLRKEANKRRILNMSSLHTAVASNSTEEAFHLQEGQRCLGRALAQLSPQKKMIYELSRHEGKSYDEIAAVLNLSPHTVKSHLITALKFVRNYLKNNALSIFLLLVSCFFQRK